MRSGRLFEEDAGRCTGALISLICQSTLRPGLGNFASAAGNILLGSTSPWTSQPAVMMTGMLNAPAAMVEVEEATGIVVLDGEAMPGTCCSLAPWHACGRAQVARCFLNKSLPHQSRFPDWCRFLHDDRDGQTGFNKPREGGRVAPVSTGQMTCCPLPGSPSST